MEALLSQQPQCPVPSVGIVSTLVTTLVQALLVAQCNIAPPEATARDYGDEALANGLGTYDFVIVGAGSAGSVVASRLSENPDWKVLVLEAGGDAPLESEVPLLVFGLQHTNYTWNYFTQPDGKSCMAYENGACYWPRGKMIGGSGAINAMMYVRGNRKDYDGWLHQGNTGWGWDDVYKWFQKSVTPVGDAAFPRGYVTLNEFERQDADVQDMVYAAAAELGYARVREFNEGTEIGYTNLPGTIKNGHRMSTGKGHLAKVSPHRANLHVLKHALATKINFDASGKRAESVTLTLRGQKQLTVQIGKELILSAGTIESAKLLMLSGVGPKQHLSELGVPLVRNLPVGHNLQDHVYVPVFIQLDENVGAPLSAEQLLDSVYQYLIHSTGPMTALGPASLTSFLNTKPGSSSPYPDIENHHMFMRRGDMMGLHIVLKGIGLKAEYYPHFERLLAKSHLLLLDTILCHPESIGELRLSGNKPDDAPILHANYLDADEDRQTLLRGVKHAQKMVATTAFRAHHAKFAHIPIKECDEVTFDSDAYWLCYIKYFSTTLYHIAGTVKMGPASDETACVDARLKLHGVENLRVADASIMPTVISANTNAATVMIGERGADFVARDWNKGHTEL